MIRSSLLFIDDDLSATTCLSRGVAYSLISLVQNGGTVSAAARLAPAEDSTTQCSQ